MIGVIQVLQSVRRRAGVFFGALALTLAYFGVGAPARATEVGSSRIIGLGFAIGAPTSLVGKYFLSSTNAVDFGLAFYRLGRRCYDGPNIGCDRFGYVGLVGDYLWQDTLARGTAQLDWHFGPGGRMWLGNDGRGNNVSLAARMPVGLDLTFEKPEFLEVFVEIAPALYIVPDTSLEVEGFLGLRFYF
jgi:hypothetical protein